MFQLTPGNPRMAQDQGQFNASLEESRADRLARLEMERYIADLSAGLERDRLALDRDRLGENTRQYEENIRQGLMAESRGMEAASLASLLQTERAARARANERKSRLEALRGYEQAATDAAPGTALERQNAGSQARSKALAAMLGVGGGQTKMIDTGRQMGRSLSASEERQLAQQAMIAQAELARKRGG